ncbi:MAG: hypothetical protein ACRDLL_05135, partial [Solirubrobacterales bacterium]
FDLIEVERRREEISVEVEASRLQIESERIEAAEAQQEPGVGEGTPRFSSAGAISGHANAV